MVGEGGGWFTMPLITPVIRANLVADKAKTPRVCWTRAAGQTTAAKTPPVITVHII